MSHEHKLLIVEDNADEMQRAIVAAKENGFTNIDTANNLEDALNKYVSATHVLTDMFFPAGNADVYPHVNIFVPRYSDSSRRALEQLQKLEQSPLYRASKQVLGCNGDNFIELISNLPAGLFSAQINHGLQDFSRRYTDSQRRYNECRIIEQKVLSGDILPCGLIIGKYATCTKIPVAIVTSTNHHDNYLQPLIPVLNALGIPFVDSYDNGKDWHRGLALLTKQNT